jgi:hypothetical protein
MTSTNELVAELPYFTMNEEEAETQFPEEFPSCLNDRTQAIAHLIYQNDNNQREEGGLSFHVNSYPNHIATAIEILPGKEIRVGRDPEKW